MSSVSGLSDAHRAKARRIVKDAAWLTYSGRSRVHYTQGGLRWQGISDTRYSEKNQYPNYADCSAFATWCLWNGLFVPFGVRDTVNGANWRAGYTGTMLKHGKVVEHLSNVKIGDCVLYGQSGTVGKHVAIIIGRRNGKLMVISHGSEPGPYYLRYNYRSDIMCIRRYI
jgi:cell wall-associated NlpC family hydrolase